MQWTCRFLLITFMGVFISNAAADNTRYIYDQLGRIKEIHYRTKQQHYIYDDVGNRLLNTVSNSDLDDTTDTDADGMPDVWELLHGLNPIFPGDASQDMDGDGLTNLQEYQAHTDPANPDTDGDGMNDSEDPNPTNHAFIWMIPAFSLLLH